MKVGAIFTAALLLSGAAYADCPIEVFRPEIVRPERAQIGVVRPEVAKIEAAKIETAKIETAKIEGVKPERAQIGAVRPETAKIESCGFGGARSAGPAREGPCNEPDDIAADGSRCGDRAASRRPDGR